MREKYYHGRNNWRGSCVIILCAYPIYWIIKFKINNKRFLLLIHGYFIIICAAIPQLTQPSTMNVLLNMAFTGGGITKLAVVVTLGSFVILYWDLPFRCVLQNKTDIWRNVKRQAVSTGTSPPDIFLIQVCQYWCNHKLPCSQTGRVAAASSC